MSMDTFHTYRTFTMSEARVVGTDWRSQSGMKVEWTEPMIIDRDEALSIITAYKVFPHDWLIELEHGGRVSCGNIFLSAWE